MLPEWSLHDCMGIRPCVAVLPLSLLLFMVCSRRLLYTAITRAKKLVVVVGDEEALWMATNTHKDHRRNSHLLWRIKNCIKYKEGLQG